MCVCRGQGGGGGSSRYQCGPWRLHLLLPEGQEPGLRASSPQGPWGLLPHVPSMCCDHCFSCQVQPLSPYLRLSPGLRAISLLCASGPAGAQSRCVSASAGVLCGAEPAALGLVPRKPWLATSAGVHTSYLDQPGTRCPGRFQKYWPSLLCSCVDHLGHLWVHPGHFKD